jgi:hypothetical protein
MNAFEQTILRMYQERGKSWLDSLPRRVQKSAALWGLGRLKSLDKLKFSDTRRVYYGFIKKFNIILLLGGNKNGQGKGNKDL